MDKNMSQFNYKKIITFIITAYTISWLIWLPNLISHNFSVNWEHSKLLHLTGGLGPIFASITTTSIFSKKRGLIAYFK